jgi:hypothetical protein
MDDFGWCGTTTADGLDGEVLLPMAVPVPLEREEEDITDMWDPPSYVDPLPRLAKPLWKPARDPKRTVLKGGDAR